VKLPIQDEHKQQQANAKTQGKVEPCTIHGLVPELSFSSLRLCLIHIAYSSFWQWLAMKISKYFISFLEALARNLN
jgi:hypothetical protein